MKNHLDEANSPPPPESFNARACKQGTRKLPWFENVEKQAKVGVEGWRSIGL